MKKIMLFVLLAVGTLVAQAQHLEFKGHPITGKLSDFVALLEKDGFMPYGTSLCKTAEGKKKVRAMFDEKMEKKHFAYFEGSFFNKNASITVLASDLDVVSVVFVNFECMEEWNDVISDFSELEYMLSKKYGEPLVQDKIGTVFTDIMAPIALSQNKIEYRTIWEMLQGHIVLELESCKIDSYKFGVQIRLTYGDKENFDSYRENKEKRLLNDL